MALRSITALTWLSLEATQVNWNRLSGPPPAEDRGQSSRDTARAAWSTAVSASQGGWKEACVGGLMGGVMHLS